MLVYIKVFNNRTIMCCIFLLKHETKNTLDFANTSNFW